MYKFGKLDIICVGILKEEYLRAAQAEYIKRLTPYGKLSIIEVSDDAKIIKHLQPAANKIALEIGGSAPSSEGFAAMLGSFAVSGHSHLQFIVGGADGLPAAISAATAHHLSLSNMTFTHQMARILLLEQVYRVCRILNNQPYHK